MLLDFVHTWNSARALSHRTLGAFRYIGITDANLTDPDHRTRRRHTSTTNFTFDGVELDNNSSSNESIVPWNGTQSFFLEVKIKINIIIGNIIKLYELVKLLQYTLMIQPQKKKWLLIIYTLKRLK